MINAISLVQCHRLDVIHFELNPWRSIFRGHLK